MADIDEFEDEDEYGVSEFASKTRAENRQTAMRLSKGGNPEEALLPAMFALESGIGKKDVVVPMLRILTKLSLHRTVVRYGQLAIAAGVEAPAMLGMLSRSAAVCNMPKLSKAYADRAAEIRRANAKK